MRVPAKLRRWLGAALAVALLGGVPQAAAAAPPRTWVAEGPSGTSPQPLVQQVWREVGGAGVADIPLGSPPTETRTLARLELGSIGESYGDRTRGFLVAPTSGAYTFWLYGDDETELRLAPDADASGAVRVAHVSGWTSPSEWSKYPSQRSAPITLAAGERYAFELLHKEGNGGAHWGVGWSKPGDGTSGPAEIVPASALGPEEPVTTTATPAFRLASDTPGATFECRLDQGAWNPCAASYTTPTLASGAYELEVRATSGRLRAIGRLPVGRRLSSTYDVALVRVVQRFQRSSGLHRGSGTIGVGTRRALDRAVARTRRTWRAP